jgi:hypothetical protein
MKKMRTNLIATGLTILCLAASAMPTFAGVHSTASAPVCEDWELEQLLMTGELTVSREQSLYNPVDDTYIYVPIIGGNYQFHDIFKEVQDFKAAWLKGRNAS